jgi:hypothetical protein
VQMTMQEKLRCEMNYSILDNVTIIYKYLSTNDGSHILHNS